MKNLSGVQCAKHNNVFHVLLQFAVDYIQCWKKGLALLDHRKSIRIFKMATLSIENIYSEWKFFVFAFDLNHNSCLFVGLYHILRILIKFRILITSTIVFLIPLPIMIINILLWKQFV